MSNFYYQSKEPDLAMVKGEIAILDRIAKVETRLPYFTEQVYNLKRLHSSRGYMSPVKYETLYTNNIIRRNPSTHPNRSYPVIRVQQDMW